MLEVVYQYRLEPARVAHAALLAAMSQDFVETGLRPAWDAARIACTSAIRTAWCWRRGPGAPLSASHHALRR